MNEASAAKYCQNLRLAGEWDWRLPSVAELLVVTKTEREERKQQVYQSGDVWSIPLPYGGGSSQTWLRTPDGHWTEEAAGDVGDRAVCVRGAQPRGMAGAPLPANFEFVTIPAGSFDMGCSPGDTQCTDDEKPLHPVTIPKPFEMSKYLVTQATWEGVMGSNPSRFQRDGRDRPVENVSWFDVQLFLSILNDRHDGYRYRLPTEAEWEYAARGRTSGARYGDMRKIAWYGENSGYETHSVGRLEPNAWGLYDMLGNVWKWVQDPYVRGGYKNPPVKVEPKGLVAREPRIKRGGSWVDLPLSIRASRRIMDEPENKGSNVGFFCVREVAP